MIDYGPDPLGVLTRTEYAEFLQGGGEQQYRVPGGVVQSAATGGELVRGVDPNGGEVHFHSAGSGSITAVGGVRLAEVAGSPTAGRCSTAFRSSTAAPRLPGRS